MPPLALPVTIEGNAGSVREVEQVAGAGAHGIGLLRTEHIFLGDHQPAMEALILAEDGDRRASAQASSTKRSASRLVGSPFSIALAADMA